MIKKKILLIVSIISIIVLSISLFVGCEKKNQNLLPNDDGVFRYKNLEELEKDWIIEDQTQKSSCFGVEYDEETNSSIISVKTSSNGWAYLAAKVNLDSGAYYKITYTISIDKISSHTSGTNYDGVFVTFLEDKDFNYKPDVDSSDVSTQPLMHLVSMGKSSYTLGFQAKSGGLSTLAFKVGTENYPVTGEIDLYNFKIEKVSKGELVDVSNYAGTFVTDYYGGQTNFNIFYIVVGAFLIAILCYIGYFMYQRHMFNLQTEKNYSGFLNIIVDKKYLGIILVIAAACFVRLLTDVLSTTIASGFIHTTMGYNLETLTTQAMFISKYGLSDLDAYLYDFANSNNISYATQSCSPLQLYFLGFCGLFGRIFESGGISSNYFATMFFVRFFLALADIGTVIIIYLLIKKSTGNLGALIVSAMYSLLPIVFASSALWGYAESLTVFLIVLTIYFMLQNKYVATAITYFIACMFSISALFIAPIILFYSILQCVKDSRKWIPFSIIFVLAFFAFYALNVPFDIKNIQDGSPFYCFTKTWNELYVNIFYAQNSFNFQSILGNNFGTVSVASIIVTIIFILFLLTLIAVAYFKFKNRMNLVLLATAFINMLYVFGNNMNPISMYMSLALMLIYAILNKEKRIYFSFIVFAILMFVNLSYYELFTEYSATAIGQISNTPVMYIFSALEIVFVLYYLYVVYDIVVTRKVRKIKEMPLSYSEWLKNTGKKIKKRYYKMRIKLQKK